MTLTDRDFNHAGNDSPRSGSSKRVTPVVWCVVVAVTAALAVYNALGA